MNKEEKAKMVQRAIDIRKRGKIPIENPIMIYGINPDHYEYQGRILDHDEARELLSKYESVYGLPNVTIQQCITKEEWEVWKQHDASCKNVD